LVSATKISQFDHVALRACEDLAEIAAYYQSAQELGDRGLTVAPRPEWSTGSATSASCATATTWLTAQEQFSGMDDEDKVIRVNLGY
jgi:hypothetical protein